MNSFLKKVSGKQGSMNLVIPLNQEIEESGPNVKLPLLTWLQNNMLQ